MLYFTDLSKSSSSLKVLSAVEGLFCPMPFWSLPRRDCSEWCRLLGAICADKHSPWTGIFSSKVKKLPAGQRLLLPGRTVEVYFYFLICKNMVLDLCSFWLLWICYKTWDILILLYATELSLYSFPSVLSGGLSSWLSPTFLWQFPTVKLA